MSSKGSRQQLRLSSRRSKSDRPRRAVKPGQQASSEGFELQSFQVGAVPLVNWLFERMRLEEILQRHLFALWHRVRDGTLSRRTFKTRMSPIRRRVEALLLRGVFSGNPRLTGMCEELYDGRENLWTFLDVERLGPTNNAETTRRRQRLPLGSGP